MVKTLRDFPTTTRCHIFTGWWKPKQCSSDWVTGKKDWPRRGHFTAASL
jgi:hypothetical protein